MDKKFFEQKQGTFLSMDKKSRRKGVKKPPDTLVTDASTAFAA